METNLKFISNAFLQHPQFLRRNYLPLINVRRLVLRVTYGFQKTAVTNHEQGWQQTNNVRIIRYSLWTKGRRWRVLTWSVGEVLITMPYSISGHAAESVTTGQCNAIPYCRNIITSQAGTKPNYTAWWQRQLRQNLPESSWMTANARSNPQSL